MLSGVFLKTYCQDSKAKKEYNKEYEVSSLTKLEIQNKFGNVDVNNWDRNTISINVEILAEAGSRERSMRILDGINIDFSVQNNTIKAITNFNSDINRGVLDNMNQGNKQIEVNYTVNMPSDVPLNLYNKYGNIFINELLSTSNIEIKYGKIKINRFMHPDNKPMSSLTMAYSNGTMEECRWLKLDIKYSKLEITKSRALIIMSKYSKIYIDEGSSIVSESKYDTYVIGKLANFVTSSGYSNFKFDEVTKKIIVETAYSDLKANYIPAGFEEIRIENKYGNYRLGFDAEASYRIEGEAKYAKIIFPDNNRVNTVNENNEMRVEGIIGNDAQPSSKVNISTKYGNIRLVD